jgi:acyl carrier protein
MSVESRLEHLFREYFNDDELTLRDEMTPDDVSGWDSLASINLMVIVEDEFGFSFEDSDFGGFSSIGELRRLIEQRV